MVDQSLPLLDPRPRVRCSELPILYSFRRCPYAMRARLAIAVSGVQVEVREVVLRDKAPEFLATSPSATVPCLALSDGSVLDESLDIMLWALALRDPAGWLVPSVGSLKDMKVLLAEVDGPFKRHLDRFKYDTRYPGTDARAEREGAAAFLHQIEGRLSNTAWLFGDRPSLADYGFLPFLRQFANVDRSWFEAESWPRLVAYLKRFESSGLFAEIMIRYAPWRAGEDRILFPDRAEP